MKFKLLILLLITIPFTVFCQVKIGDKIDLRSINLNALNNAQLENNKIIVLDFWATWCAPCIASFPHLDSIQTALRNKIQIVAVSDESKTRVSNFLSKRNHLISFFTDENKTLFKLFEIEARPLTAVINPEGTLVWVGNSIHLEEVLHRINSNEQVPTPTQSSLRKYYLDIPKNGDAIYTYQISISDKNEEFEAKTQKGIYLDSAINIYYRGATVVDIIQDLISVSDLQMVNNKFELDTIFINLTSKSSSNKINYKFEKERIIDDLQRVFNFNIKKENKDVQTYSIVIVDDKKLKLNKEEIEGGGMAESKENKFIITRLSLAELASFFERKLRTFVQYKGSDVFKYNLELEKFTNIEELNKQLESKFGLRLEPYLSSVLFIEIN